MKKQNIPSWIWIIMVILVLIIVLLMLNMPSGKETKEINPLIIGLCENQQVLCESEVRVYGEDRDCYEEYLACLIR